uniref:Uncharacterized protein n=1 Tax=Knipowitschia caucasica TaxID=637954 RepID=A0AAV2KAV9_KNICA
MWGPRHLLSLLEQKEDLRKRLSYTTHKLELLQNEFDSTKVYLETELRRAQEELDKFTDKLRRIQSGYSALQRINQDLEEKIHRDTHQVPAVVNCVGKLTIAVLCVSVSAVVVMTELKAMVRVMFGDSVGNNSLAQC